jgi:hypothetical protein
MTYKMKYTDGKKASPAKFFGKKSPVKGKAKKAAAAARADEAMTAMQDQLSGKDFKSSSILSKSPVKIDWGKIATDAASAAVQTGVSEGVQALAKGKKQKKKDVAGGATTGAQQFGSGSKIT